MGIYYIAIIKSRKTRRLRRVFSDGRLPKRFVQDKGQRRICRVFPDISSWYFILMRRSITEDGWLMIQNCTDLRLLTKSSGHCHQLIPAGMTVIVSSQYPQCVDKVSSECHNYGISSKIDGSKNGLGNIPKSRWWWSYELKVIITELEISERNSNALMHMWSVHTWLLWRLASMG